MLLFAIVFFLSFFFISVMGQSVLESLLDRMTQIAAWELRLVRRSQVGVYNEAF